MLLFMFQSPTEIYTLSLHDALPIFTREIIRELRQRAHDAGARLRGRCRDIIEERERIVPHRIVAVVGCGAGQAIDTLIDDVDRKSTRLNSSHANISYAVFCLKKKKI